MGRYFTTNILLLYAHMLAFFYEFKRTKLKLPNWHKLKALLRTNVLNDITAARLLVSFSQLPLVKKTTKNGWAVTSLRTFTHSSAFRRNIRLCFLKKAATHRMTFIKRALVTPTWVWEQMGTEMSSVSCFRFPLFPLMAANSPYMLFVVGRKNTTVTFFSFR